jgi:thioredoxin 1
MSKNIHHIQTADELETLINHSAQPVVVDYWAPWCGPCKALNPILEAAAEELGDEAIIAKVNIDDLPGLARSNDVSSIPTLFYYHKQRLRHRSTGITDLSGILTRVQSYTCCREPQAV